MAFIREYALSDPSRQQIESLKGATLLEFGNSWCGHCRRAEPAVRQAFASHPDVRHVKIADANGKRLGRSFGVKLWPTLVFLRNGVEITRLIRPSSMQDVEEAMNAVTKVEGL